MPVECILYLARRVDEPLEIKICHVVLPLRFKVWRSDNYGLKAQIMGNGRRHNTLPETDHVRNDDAAEFLDPVYPEANRILLILEIKEFPSRYLARCFQIFDAVDFEILFEYLVIQGTRSWQCK